MVWNRFKKNAKSVQPVKEDEGSSEKSITTKRVAFSDAVKSVEIEACRPEDKGNIWYSKKHLSVLFDAELEMNNARLPVYRSKWEHHRSLSWRGMEHLSADWNEDKTRTEMIRETVREVVKYSKKHDDIQKLESFACKLSKKANSQAQKRGALDERAVKTYNKTNEVFPGRSSKLFRSMVPGVMENN